MGMIKIGITGQSGFIGWHLYNFLKLKEDVKLIEFDKNYFCNREKLDEFVLQSDVIVHLAAMNRAKNSRHLYDTNILLVQQLIDACERTNSRPHILLSSSIQEDSDNAYGKSKKGGRILLEDWSKRSGGIVTSMLIPNVFGPFGRPNYNSVVATFCHKITRNEVPVIYKDAQMGLIYIGGLVAKISDFIRNRKSGKIIIKPFHKISVSALLKKLQNFKQIYMDNGEIPCLDEPFDLALFNTFRCYIPDKHFPFMFTKYADNRGSFVEVLRANSKGQYSYSTTVSGITRGNHFHTRKVERFVVISGKARILLRKIGTKEIIEYILDGDTPSFVDIPIWFTHNITNIGKMELITLFWINEPYDPLDADTYYEDV